jgi:hypothetical protein
MAILDYASPMTERKPFSYRPLIIALGCLVFMLIFFYVLISFDPFDVSFAFVVGFSRCMFLVGEVNTMISLITICRRHRSAAQLFWVLLVSIICLLGHSLGLILAIWPPSLGEA